MFEAHSPRLFRTLHLAAYSLILILCLKSDENSDIHPNTSDLFLLIYRDPDVLTSW